MLAAALSRANAGEGAVVLVGGEPGIGKTSLIDRFAGAARDQGVPVVWGQCWEAGGAPAYWPIVQAVRTIVRENDADTVRRYTGAGAADLAQIVPDIRDVLVDVPEPHASDPDTARFRLFDAAASFLRAAARDRGLVVALDDMHSADTPSMLLLEYLAREVRGARITLVVSYRSTEVTPEHPLASTLAELTRVPGARRVTLEGLAPGEISEYVAQVTGTGVKQSVVDALDARTEGNPLFVSEIIRLMLAEGLTTGAMEMPDEIPEGVHETIARRVARLSSPCRDALHTAAVLGRDVPQDVLQLLSDLDPRSLLDALDEAAGAGILVPAAIPTGDFRFSHVLVRDALYAQLPTAARAHAHLGAAAAIEKLHARDLEPHQSEIAHHYIAAGPVADPATAAQHAACAGETAIRRLAYEEAARLLRASIELTERSTTANDTLLDLLLALGDAEARAGDQSSAQATMLRAAELARRQGKPDALARAAIGYGGRFVWCRAGADTELVRLLEDALAAVGAEDSILRVQLLARLSNARRSDPDPAPRRTEAVEAVAIARRLGDAHALGKALGGYYGAIWEASTVEERLQVAEEMLERAAQADDIEEVVNAHCLRSVASWELGDFARARADVDAIAALAPGLRQPAQRWQATISRAAVALFEGRFSEAEELALAGPRQGQGSLQFDADAACVVQMALVRLEQGRAGELLPEVERAADAYPWYAHLRCAHARLLASDGRLGLARALVERLAPSQYAAVPATDNYSTFGLSLLADVVGELRDPSLAAPMLERLLPYVHLSGMGPPEVSSGANARPVAVLCGVLGRVAEAERHFEDAIRRNREMGARPWVARSLYQYAEMLQRASTADDDRVRVLLGEAGAIARDLGMADLSFRIADDTWSGADATEQVFHREGEYWTITFGGRSIRMRDSKGHRYLAALLAVPGRDVPAVDLAALGTSAATTTEAQPANAGSDELLDAQSRAAYRGRIEELQEEIDEAQAWNDAERAALAEEELDALVGHLAAATGLGGRSRAFASDAERARQRVKKAISASLARIESEHAELGRHLSSTIRTGYQCRYQPDPRAAFPWRT